MALRQRQEIGINRKIPRQQMVPQSHLQQGLHHRLVLHRWFQTVKRARLKCLNNRPHAFVAAVQAIVPAVQAIVPAVAETAVAADAQGRRYRSCRTLVTCLPYADMPKPRRAEAASQHDTKPQSDLAKPCSKPPCNRIWFDEEPICRSSELWYTDIYVCTPHL